MIKFLPCYIRFDSPCRFVKCFFEPFHTWGKVIGCVKENFAGQQICQSSSVVVKFHRLHFQSLQQRFVNLEHVIFGFELWIFSKQKVEDFLQTCWFALIKSSLSLKKNLPRNRSISFCYLTMNLKISMKWLEAQRILKFLARNQNDSTWLWPDSAGAQTIYQSEMESCVHSKRHSNRSQVALDFTMSFLSSQSVSFSTDFLKLGMYSRIPLLFRETLALESEGNWWQKII